MEAGDRNIFTGKSQVTHFGRVSRQLLLKTQTPLEQWDTHMACTMSHGCELVQGGHSSPGSCAVKEWKMKVEVGAW